jgi:dienelactone hydrolase
LVAAVVFVVLAAGAGGWLLAGAGGSAGHRHTTVDAVPLDEVHPAGARRPGVVVAHGFAGSARLMAQFGDTLAARGYVVVLLDFTGHGANTRPLPDAAAGTEASTAALQRDLDVAVTHLRGLPDVDPARIALVGHSMGAAAVTRYAAGHPDITATVAISLPGSPAALPDRLLALVGQLEFPGFRAEAARATAGAGPGRSMTVDPGVEHISILYAPRAHRETADFLDDSFGQANPAGATPSPFRRVAGAGALLLALLAGLYPVARLLLTGTRHLYPVGGLLPDGVRRPDTAGRPLPGGRRGWWRIAAPLSGRTVVVAAAGFAVAAVVARWLPTGRLPQAIGNYLVGFTVTGGAVLLAYHRLRPSPPPAAPISRPGGRRLAFAAPILIGYAAVTIAVPLHLGLTHAVPVGNRWWLLPIMWGGFALLAYAGDRLAAGNVLGLLTVSAVAVAVLTGAAVAGLTFGFVLLIVPLLAVLLLWQAVWAAMLSGFAAPRRLVAAVSSLIVAWPLSTALPLAAP